MRIVAEPFVIDMFDGRKTLGNVGDLRIDLDAFLAKLFAGYFQYISDIQSSGVNNLWCDQAGMCRNVIGGLFVAFVGDTRILHKQRQMSCSVRSGDGDRRVYAVSTNCPYQNWSPIV